MTFHVKVAERWGTKSLGMGVIAVAVAAVIGVIASVSKASAGTVTVNDMSWWGDSGVSVTILESHVFRFSDWSPADHRGGLLQRVQRLVHRLQQ